jgi:uncharacterized membrane protein
MQGLKVFKMNKKQFISLILLFLFVVSISSGVAFASSDDHSISSMDVDLYLKDDGNLHVKKTIHYFLSEFTDESQDIDIEREQNPENLKVYSQGAYCGYDIDKDQFGTSISMDFYSDPEKTIPIGNDILIRKKKVNVIIEYDLPQAIKFYNDIAQLQYKLVDDNGIMTLDRLMPIYILNQVEMYRTGRLRPLMLTQFGMIMISK